MIRPVFNAPPQGAQRHPDGSSDHAEAERAGGSRKTRNVVSGRCSGFGRIELEHRGLSGVQVFLYAEWNNKAAGFVSYGIAGGVRAVEQLRLVVGELQVADVRTQVSFSLFSDFENMTTFTPGLQHEHIAETMLTQFAAWTEALRPLRG